MEISYSDTPSEGSLEILAALKEAVTEALDKKLKLGQYAVFWDGKQPICIGPDAPKN